MKLFVRVLAALSVLALATPALACGDMKQTTTAATQTKATKPVAKAEKADKKAEAKRAKAAQQGQGQTAQN